MKNLLFILMIVGVCACNSGTTDNSSTETNSDYEKELQTQLINAEPGAVIEIPEGRFSFKRTLSLDGVPQVTIRGAGMDKTFLSFKDQIDGAEGLSMYEIKNC